MPLTPSDADPLELFLRLCYVSKRVPPTKYVHLRRISINTSVHVQLLPRGRNALTQQTLHEHNLHKKKEECNTRLQAHTHIWPIPLIFKWAN